MPVLKNNSKTTKRYIDLSGIVRSFKPGEEVQSYFFPNDIEIGIESGDPIFNPILKRDIVDLDAVQEPATGVDVDINSSSDYLYVFKITNSVTVYRQDITNTPAEFYNITEDDPMIPMPTKRLMSKIHITGTGTCEVVQYQDIETLTKQVIGLV